MRADMEITGVRDVVALFRNNIWMFRSYVQFSVPRDQLHILILIEPSGTPSNHNIKKFPCCDLEHFWQDSLIQKRVLLWEEQRCEILQNVCRCKIWGSHISTVEDSRLPGVQFSTFRRVVTPPISRLRIPRRLDYACIWHSHLMLPSWACP